MRILEADLCCMGASRAEAVLERVHRQRTRRKNREIGFPIQVSGRRRHHLLQFAHKIPF